MKIDVKWAWHTVYFENCHVLNPHDFSDTGMEMNFEVQPDGELYPCPIIEGPYRNCSELPAGEPKDTIERSLEILHKYYGNKAENILRKLLHGW